MGQNFVVATIQGLFKNIFLYVDGMGWKAAAKSFTLKTKLHFDGFKLQSKEKNFYGQKVENIRRKKIIEVW